MEVLSIGIFLLLALLVVVIPILIGVYVYTDAKKRGMNAVLWTLVAVLAPTFIGLIIYLIVRGDHASQVCPQCKTQVLEHFMVCPQCGAPLKNKCAQCGFVIEPGWKICPQCSAPVPEGLQSIVPVYHKDKALSKILIAVILIPILLGVLLVVGLVPFARSASSMTTTSGFDLAQIEGNQPVTDWISECDAIGDGIYILNHQEWVEGGVMNEYLIYRKGVSGITDVTVNLGQRGFFTNPAMEIKYHDSAGPTATDYSLTHVLYYGKETPNAIVFINGVQQNYHLASTAVNLGLEILEPAVEVDPANEITIEVINPQDFEIGSVEINYLVDGEVVMTDVATNAEHTAMRGAITLSGFDARFTEGGDITAAITLFDLSGKQIASLEYPVEVSGSYRFTIAVDKDGKVILTSENH